MLPAQITFNCENESLLWDSDLGANSLFQDLCYTNDVTCYSCPSGDTGEAKVMEGEDGPKLGLYIKQALVFVADFNLV